LPNVVKIDPYNFELYRFKVGAFLRHSVNHDCNASHSYILHYVRLRTTSLTYYLKQRMKNGRCSLKNEEWNHPM